MADDGAYDIPQQRMNASDVVATMRRDIADGQFLLHERLPAERDLSTRFGIARGTLREALRQLEELGYVERRAGSGTYVKWTPDESVDSIVETTRPLDLMDARFAIEPHTCRLCVLHCTDRDLDRLDAVLHKMETCGDDIGVFADADEEFHMLLAELTGNMMIRWMMQQVCKVRTHTQWAQMRTLTLDQTMMAHYNREHRDILEAIRGREPENAANAMKHHLSAARASLISVAQR